MADIKIEGLDKLQKALKQNVHNGQQLQQRMHKNADFKKGYQTGTTKRSIIDAGGMTFEDDGLTVNVGPQTEYSPYLEFGTRFMDAQKFVRPALNMQAIKFKVDMMKLTR